MQYSSWHSWTNPAHAEGKFGSNVANPIMQRSQFFHGIKIGWVCLCFISCIVHACFSEAETETSRKKQDQKTAPSFSSSPKVKTHGAKYICPFQAKHRVQAYPTRSMLQLLPLQKLPVAWIGANGKWANKFPSPHSKSPNSFKHRWSLACFLAPDLIPGSISWHNSDSNDVFMFDQRSTLHQSHTTNPSCVLLLYLCGGHPRQKGRLGWQLCQHWGFLFLHLCHVVDSLKKQRIIPSFTGMSSRCNPKAIKTYPKPRLSIAWIGLISGSLILCMPRKAANLIWTSRQLPTTSIFIRILQPIRTVLRIICCLSSGNLKNDELVKFP